MSAPQRFVFFVLLSTALWCAFVPLYGWFFAWAEFVPGINWVYLPHGMRMILVLLFGVAGAVGFTLGAAVLGWAGISNGGETLTPQLNLALAVVPGLAALAAARLTLRDWPGRYLLPRVLGRVAAVDGRRLLLLAFASAVLNSAGHGMAGLTLGAGNDDFGDRFLAMFVGDLLGALLLLYILLGVVTLIDHTLQKNHVSKETQKGSGRPLSAVPLDAERPARSARR